MAKECLFLCTGPVNDLKTYLDINYIDYNQGLYNLNIYSIDIIGLPGQIASYNCVLRKIFILYRNKILNVSVPPGYLNGTNTKLYQLAWPSRPHLTLLALSADH